jgi:Ca-activated chloride channel homolog
VDRLNLANLPALFWLLPLSGIVITLYLLKMRRRDLRVPATFLWPTQVEEIRANSLFQRLRFSWLLLLQLLALLLIVVALARPQTRQNGLAGEVTVLVVDTSASMNATDVQPSRFAEAIKLARDTILGAKASDRLALIEAGPTPRVVFSLGNDPAKQIRALETIEPSDSSADTGEALRLASALVGGIDGARIVLLSDGCFDPIANFSRGKAAVLYKSIGSLDENLGISALGTADTAAGRQIYVGVKNYSHKPMESVVSLYADGKAIDSVKATIGPKATWGRTVAAPASGKVFEARLGGRDLLASDDYAVAIVDPAASIRALLVSRGDPFTERALALDPRMTLDKATAYPVDGGDQYDLVVFDGVPTHSTKARGVLSLGEPIPSLSGASSGVAKGPKFVSSEKSELLNGVSFGDVFIDQQVVVKPSPRATVQAETSAGPLVITANTPLQRQIFLAFPPLQSDFPLQVGFPIFIANALTFLAGPNGADDLTVEPGRPFSVSSRTDVVVAGEKGEAGKTSARDGIAVVRSIRKVGAYKLTADGKTKHVYAALRATRESDVAPVANLALGGGQVKATVAPARFGDFWRPLILIGLLVLAGEWWLFARKS